MSKTEDPKVRKFIDNLRLYRSLPDNMQCDIIKELDEIGNAQAVDAFGHLVDKYVFAFTSNA